MFSHDFFIFLLLDNLATGETSGLRLSMDGIPVRHIKQPQKELEAFGAFSIRDIETVLAGEDMIQELHRHDFYYMLALRKGAGHHNIDFTPYIIADNSVFFMRPGQVHRLELKAGSTGCLMQFRNEFDPAGDKASNRLLHKAGSVNHYQPDATRFQRLFAVLADILREYTGKQDGYQDVIKADMRILLIELIRGQAGSPADHSGLYRQEKLDRFLELLETHVFTHKQVSQYADMLNLSAYQLNTITKATLGKTCSELIDAHIILEAKRYLLATSNQVSQIAYHLGYEDVSYFIRFFKKHMGYSPDTFRHNFS